MVRAKWTKKVEQEKKGKEKKPKAEKKHEAEKKPVTEPEKKPEPEPEKKPEPEPEKKPEAKAADVNEDDLFGGGEDLEAAKKILEEKKKTDEAAKKKDKKTVVAKSYVRFEVKIFDNTTDLDVLAKRIFREMKLDGLVWEKEYKKEPFAFGVEKLIISCVIEDDKISTDDITEPILAFDDEELVQSMDILVFNKL